ncbi:zinc metalloproteinase nas-4-like [Hydractinia symbiolongicarpus]|uniref:zinc metalloproteinase nas-4-like n=1 Tax=Hydractinia symbiolongicarpus TaxID=13093 RepID=UPI00254F72B6|nr:zinc metalloproteinase nas-4-like [Hydractinia symbiolongicarpus]
MNISMGATLYTVLFFMLLVHVNTKSPPKPKLSSEAKDDDDENTFDHIIKQNEALRKINKDAFSSGPETFEGDIIMTDKLQKTIEEMRIRSEAGMSTFDAITGGVWPNGEVPYKFAPGFSYQNAVYQAIKEFEAKTCIKLKPYTAALARKAGGYVEFMHGGGCLSYVGRQRGKQQISLGRGCGTKGVAVHEIMHALGFYHEQSRRDRDGYITINWNNIPKNLWYAFQKYKPGGASYLGEPYDKQSVMHYGNYAFSNNRQKTIVSKSNPNERLGQRNGLSPIDVNQLNKYYKCGGGPTITNPPPTACNNLYPFCKVLTKWCTNQWVKGNCKDSCNLCNKPPPPPCNDKDKSGNCGYWTRAGYCKHKEYKGFMQDNCKKSCKLC